MKWGLGQSYDRVLVNKRLRAYIDITKPASTVGVAGAYFVASLLYFFYVGEPHLIPDKLGTIFVVVATIGLAHGASQAMNMAEDAEMDRQTEHKQNRPIPSGVIEEEDARSVSWLSAGLALGLSFTVSNVYGAFMMVLIFFGIFYNLDPIRAKERIISIPWQAASRGLLSFPAVWAAYGNPFDPVAWILGAFMFFYVLGFQNSADIIDRHVDREHGIRTFVVEWGVKGTSIIALSAMLMMVAVVLGGYTYGIIPAEMMWILGVVPLCVVMLYHMRFNPHKVSEATGNHPAWLWFYGGMILTVVLPLLPYLVSV